MLWYIKNKGQAYKKLRQETDLNALECLLLANRDIEVDMVEDFLHPSFENLNDPFLFKEMNTAVLFILECFHAAIPIRIVGDYDQDGVAASSILLKGLRFLAKHFSLDPNSMVSYAIPNRMEDGYGINKNIVNEALDQGIGLIITCDNGIAAFEALSYAYEMQLPVIVTDHHRVPVIDGEEERVACEAILNPHVKDETYPFKDLCGAAVAWKLIQALFIACDIKDDYIMDLLAFAALGTICDVMPLKGENRSICFLGLQALNKRKNPGINALLDAVSWTGEISVYTIGFIIGPCINASGRLMTARLGVELFIEDDDETLRAYANELLRLNNDRKAMTTSGLDKALELLSGQKKDKILILYLEGIHESVCGLIAGRLKDRFNRPCIVFTDGGENREEAFLKGSGRSIEAYHMFNELNKYRDQYLAFGGHAMACGISIEKSKFQELKDLWLKSCQLSDEDLKMHITFDGRLDLKALNVETMDSIESLAPYGAENPSPIFACTNVNCRSLRLVGKNKNVLQAFFEKDGASFQAVLFAGDKKLKELAKQREDGQDILNKFLEGRDPGQPFDILYRPEWNEFNNQKRIQLKLLDIRFSRL